jgi:hypothetical protein
MPGGGGGRGMPGGGGMAVGTKLGWAVGKGIHGGGGGTGYVAGRPPGGGSGGGGGGAGSRASADCQSIDGIHTNGYTHGGGPSGIGILSSLSLSSCV